MAGQILKSYTFLGCRILTNYRNSFSNRQPMIRTMKSDTKELLNELKIPEKPKKPLTPYIQFLQEKRLEVAKENPNMKQAEIMKKVAKDWKEVSQEQKEKYTEKYQSESISYNAAILNYNASLSSDQQAVLKTAAAEKREDKKKRQIRKLSKENNKPKRPVGPYILFLQEQSKARNIPLNCLLTTMKGEWDKIPEVEKLRYRDQYLAQKKIFDRELLEWEHEMVEKGHSELIRTKSIIEKKPSRIHLLKGKEPHQ